MPVPGVQVAKHCQPIVGRDPRRLRIRRSQRRWSESQGPELWNLFTA